MWMVYFPVLCLVCLCVEFWHNEPKFGKKCSSNRQKLYYFVLTWKKTLVFVLMCVNKHQYLKFGSLYVYRTMTKVWPQTDIAYLVHRESKSQMCFLFIPSVCSWCIVCLLMWWLVLTVWYEKYHFTKVWRVKQGLLAFARKTTMFCWFGEGFSYLCVEFCKNSQ